MSPSRTPASRFIFVMCGKRDFYQIPLALAEGGLLERLVTDIYVPEKLRRFLPRYFASRFAPGIPFARARTSILASITNLVLDRLGVSIEILYFRLSAKTARVAARSARETGQALYCYHEYVPDDLPPDQPLVIFAYHPPNAYDRALVDAELHASFGSRALERTSIAAPRRHSDHLDFSRANAVVCASSFTREGLIAHGCPPEIITVIPYGCPPALLDTPIASSDIASSGSLQDEEVRFLFVGQGVVRKGLHHLIRAWNDWRSQTSVPARLTIIANRIDPWIDEIPRDPSIELLGYQSREALEAAFAAHPVFIMPSLIEGFGLVYVEALAHGCHVIGTRNSGLPDLDLGPDDVTYVTPGDTADIVAALERTARRMRERPFDRAAIRAAALRWTQADFRRAIIDHARSVLDATHGSQYEAAE